MGSKGERLLCGKWVVLGSLPLLALLFLLSFVVELTIKPDALLRLGLFNGTVDLTAIQPQPILLQSPPPPPPAGHNHNLSLFIGILTLPDMYERRHLLRMLYGGMSSSAAAEIDVRFVFCDLAKPEQHLFIGLEILRYNDIIILNCTENMNSGKSYSYLSSLPSILPRRYDYVMKADDDVLFRLDRLAARLSNLSRTDLYYGFVIPCDSMDPFRSYMSGMGYALSWDLVEWVATSDVPRNRTEGAEDLLVGEWFAIGNKARNRYNEKPAMYNFPGTDIPACSHDLIPDTVAVHKLKHWEQWRDVISFFNLTKGIPPSKLYHINS